MKKAIASSRRSQAIICMEATLGSTEKSRKLLISTIVLKGTVREDVRMLDQVLLGETITKEIFAPLLELNGLPGRCKATWGGLNPEEVAATGALLVQATQAGLEPTDDAIELLSERFDFGVQRAQAADPSSDEDTDSPVFDPDKDIVAQRELWREGLKKKKSLSEARLAADEEGHWVTVDGQHLFIKDSTTGGKSDKLPSDAKSDKAGSGRAPGSIDSAAHYAGRGAEASPGHDSTSPERRARVSGEERRLREWGEANGKLKGKLPREDTRGGEHIVQIPSGSEKDSSRVIKATRADAQQGYGVSYGTYSQGATPSEYLDRISTQNRIFNDDVKLERIVPVGQKVSIVTSQPFIQGRDATEEEIDGYMFGKGFEKIGLGTYHHSGEGLLAHDLVPQNAKVSAQSGQVRPIDPVIQRVTPDFAADLKNHPISTQLSAQAAFTLHPSDAIADRKAAVLAAAYKGALAPVRQIILDSSSPEEAQANIAKYFRDWKPERVNAITEEALQLCAAAAFWAFLNAPSVRSGRTQSKSVKPVC